MTSVYYPASIPTAAEPVPYVWDPDVLIPGLARRFVDSGARFDEARLRALRAHAVAGAPLAEGGLFPVIVFSHGKGAHVVQNVSRVEDLASHGYVVIAIEHPGGAFATVLPGGRVVPFVEMDDGERLERWGAEIDHVIDRLPALLAEAFAGRAHRVDVSRLGVMGRAFGGGAMTRAASREPRIAAVLNLGDEVPASISLSQPYLEIDPAAHAGRGLAMCARGRGPAYLLTVEGLGTTGLSDTPYLPWIVPPADRLVGTIDPVLAARIVGRAIAAFFDRYLRGDANASLVALASDHPEIRLELWRV